MNEGSAKPLMDAEHDRFKNDPEYVLECLYLELTEQIIDYMQRGGVSQAELARRMGVSQAYVSKIFGETSNLTLMTLAKIAAALEVDIEADVVPRCGVHREAQTNSIEHWLEKAPRRVSAESFTSTRSTRPWPLSTVEAPGEGEKSLIAA